jgi:hypothetical protein
LVFVALGIAGPAHADTRIGLAVVGDSAGFAEGSKSVLGPEVSLVTWEGRFGLAAEGAAACTNSMHEGVAWLGVSARLRFLRAHTMRYALDGTATPIMFDLDAETVVQHEWWDWDLNDPRAPERTSYGVGLGTSIATNSATTIAGVRAAVRVMVTPERASDVATRMLAPGPTTHPELGVIVMVGTELGRRN